MIGIGLHLLHMWWPSSYKSSSVPGRGSWIVERVPSSCGRKAWWALRTFSGRCAQNVMLVAPMPVTSSGTSSPRRAPPVPGPNSSLTLVGHWRNTRFFSACRIWTSCVQEAILAEELEHSLHPPNGKDLSVELDKAHTCMDMIDGEPSRPGHAAHPKHSPTPKVSSGSLAGDRPRLAAHARSAGLRCRSMGLSSETAIAPMTSGCPPHCSFTFFSFFILPTKRL
jgi:hypothetical protein